MEALEVLRKIRDIAALIKEYNEQIEEIYTEVTSTTQKIKDINVQTSLPADPMADAVIDMQERKKELVEYVKQLEKYKADVMSVMKHMDVKEQRLLIMRYFKGWTVYKISTEIDYSYQWTFDMLKQAEKNFSKLWLLDSI